jgi:pyridoxine 4-dehydrogenase
MAGKCLKSLPRKGLADNFEHSPENVKRSVENSLKILDGKKKIDIFEPARVDKNVPFETTLKALEEYVKAGKIGGISLSEVGAATIQKAVKVTTIVAIEVELSLWSLDILNNGVAKAAAECNIPIVAYVFNPSNTSQ